jgi:beta-glucosidase-like glycosyl hydrolase
VDKRLDWTHAASDGRFVPEHAQVIPGDLGAGGIHDLYPTAARSNAIQGWVMEHNRLHIPVLFTGEALHGFNNFEGTLFPSPINLAATPPSAACKASLIMRLGHTKWCLQKRMDLTIRTLTRVATFNWC